MAEDNPPVFPNPADHARSSGMTLRDWFAGQALASLCARGDPAAFNLLAERAYMAADGMMAVRKRT